LQLLGQRRNKFALHRYNMLRGFFGLFTLDVTTFVTNLFQKLQSKQDKLDEVREELDWTKWNLQDLNNKGNKQLAKRERMISRQNLKIAIREHRIQKLEKLLKKTEQTSRRRKRRLTILQYKLDESKEREITLTTRLKESEELQTATRASVSCVNNR